MVINTVRLHSYFVGECCHLNANHSYKILATGIITACISLSCCHDRIRIINEDHFILALSITYYYLHIHVHEDNAWIY